ncbi:MAG: MarR family transcriptional regulator [Spirochaetales bacterium]|nr:MarR family transcriptional regulator [Spirochaetales bacterium]
MGNEILLIELLNNIRKRLLKRLSPLKKEGPLSFAEILVLHKLYHRKKCRVTDLAREFGIPPSTLTGMLDRLVIQGFIERGMDPNDRRGVILTVTEATVKLVRERIAAVTESLRGIFLSLPPERQERLIIELQYVLECLEREEKK